VRKPSGCLKKSIVVWFRGAVGLYVIREGIDLETRSNNESQQVKAWDPSLPHRLRRGIGGIEKARNQATFVKVHVSALNLL
jgi:hypothetical protein